MQYQETISYLKQNFPKDRFFTDPADCWPYGYDYSRNQSLPDGVVFPTTVQEIQNIVKCCYENNTPLIARGYASGATGGTVPIYGGVVISLEKMDKILNFDPENKVIQAEAGAINKDIQNTANKQGFFWAPDPTSIAHSTIGGNISCNAAGPRAIKYGTCRENTLGLTAITGTGEIINTGVYTTKGVVGYDLTRLLIGSEGTLGIIANATLKLTALPEDKITFILVYKNIESATQAISAIMAKPITPCILEFMDEECIKLIQNNGIVLPENSKALLILEVDGNKNELLNNVNNIIKTGTNNGLVLNKVANNLEDIEKIWGLRKALPAALRKIAPKKLNEDIVVPVSNIPVIIKRLEEISKKHGIKIVNFGHAGNGNIHTNLLIDTSDEKQMQQSKPCLQEVFEETIKLNGTLSGEHGIGIEKKPFTPLALDAATTNIMKNIKKVFDPKNILNPGKIFV